MDKGDHYKKDSITGLHKFFYFSTEYEHRRGELKHSGHKNMLFIADVPGYLSEQELVDIADYMNNQFIKVGIHRSDESHIFLGIYGDTDHFEEMRYQMTSYIKQYEGSDIRSIEFDGDSPDLESLLELVDDSF